MPSLWAAIGLDLVRTGPSFTPAALERGWTLMAACAIVISSLRIEKGMGLLAHGFLPFTLHELIEYAPGETGWRATAGIRGFGPLILGTMLRVTVAVFTNPTPATTPPAASTP